MLLPALLGVGCVSPPHSKGAPEPAGEDYLRYVAFEVPGHERVLLRWPKTRMPLRIFLPRPPESLFERPDAIYDSVRDGVLDWTDAAGPGVPRFTFVDDPREADIPIVWAAEPDGHWYIAHCVYEIQVMSRRFGVSRILVTGRYRDRVADSHDLYDTMLHEMGHALGLGGHSPDVGDIMYPSSSKRVGSGLSDRDRATLRALYRSPIGRRVVNARQYDP